MRRADPQTEIELPTQARPRRRESPSVYRRVLTLRRRGFTVHRAGFDRHLVNGRTLTGRQLRWLVDHGAVPDA